MEDTLTTEQVHSFTDMEEGEFTLEDLRVKHELPKHANFYMGIKRLLDQRFIRKVKRGTYISTPITHCLYVMRTEPWNRSANPHQARKIAVLTHYGNGNLACVKCGEDRIACLSIDHINGRGSAHRKTLQGSGKGYYMYTWLQREGHPGGYQTLCMNCQWVKRFEQGENFHRAVHQQTNG